MQVNICEFKADEAGELADFLSAERWHFHSTPLISGEKVIEQLENGYYTGDGKRSFWIYDSENKIGFIRLFDLGKNIEDSETPLFDIRITGNNRGKGTGTESLKWLTDFVFTTYPNKNRFEATTRADNAAMRRVFEKCGFVKEAHYRQAWPDENKNLYDCTGYAILRTDWLNKTKTPVNFDF